MLWTSPAGKLRFSPRWVDTTTIAGPNPGYPKWDGKDLLTDDGTEIVRWDTSIAKSLSDTRTDPLPIGRENWGYRSPPDGKKVGYWVHVVDANTGHKQVQLQQRMVGIKAAWSPDGA